MIISIRVCPPAIAAVSNTNKKKIGKAFKLIIENLEINLKESRPGHYVVRHN